MAQACCHHDATEENKTQPHKNQPGGQRYICPMGEGVVADKPGSCPKCGMALVPEGGSQTDDAPETDPDRYALRFWLCTALTLPLFAGHLADMLGLSLPLAVQSRQLIELALSLPVVTWGAWPFYKRALTAASQGHMNMFTLISLGVLIAYGYSLVAVAAPGLFPAAFHVHGSTAVAVHFVAAAMITTLVLLGQLLENKAHHQTGAALRELLDRQPRMARRLDEAGNVEDIRADAVEVGDRLEIRPGDAIPVDGRVQDGESTLDEAMLTGEPTPAHKARGDTVRAATQNQRGHLIIEATQVGSDTAYARIISLVRQAQQSRPPVQRLVDKVSAIFIPIVISAAILTFILWSTLGQNMAFGLLNGIAVLIVACPCALGLATPLSITVATGQAARAGLLVKDARVLETLEQIDTVAFDKTGTLTEGKPRVQHVQLMQDCPELRAAIVAIEARSEHALAEAVVRYFKADCETLPKLPSVEQFEAVTGHGVQAQIIGTRWLIGNEALIKDHGITCPQDDAKPYRDKGLTVIYLAKGEQCHGFIAIGDAIKPEAAAAIQSLKRQNKQVLLLTGDNAGTARAVARTLGIEDARAGILPDEKHQVIGGLVTQGRQVAMVGDGVNDAPALAAATLGLAMGSGTDVAIESADVTLLRGNLTLLSSLFRLGTATMHNIRLNLVLAFGYNVLAIPVAAGILYPWLGWLPGPMLAAVAMSASSLSVVLNALRLRRIRLEGEA